MPHARLRALNERVLPRHSFFAPDWLVLGVNNFCNLNCRMCDVGTGNAETNFGGNLTGTATRIMPLDLYTHILDELDRHAPDTRLGFAFTEPLAWPHLGEALALAQARGRVTSVTTNGLLLPRLAEMLGTTGCESVNVSIDGPAEIHDHIRRKPQSHARAVAGIRALRAVAGAPPVTVVATVTQWNAGHLAQMVREMADLDLAGIVITHNSFITEAMADRHNAGHSAFAATHSNDVASDIGAIDLALLERDLTEALTVSLPFSLKIQPHIVDAAGLAAYYQQHGSYVGSRCRDIFRILMIDSDGEAIPAHGRCFRFPIGNIRDVALPQLWNAPPLRGLRGELARAGGLMPACARCCSAY